MNTEPLDDVDMIESSEDFTAAYESHAPAIYRFLFWRTKDQQLAEDLTGNVFEKAWRSRHRFHGGSVRAWFYCIAHNQLIDHWRKRKDILLGDIDQLSEAVFEPQVTELLDEELTTRQVQIALTKLPLTMRRVVVLRFVMGLPCKKVALKLHITEGNVRIIQYRALQRLREYLQ